ncbi:unnamed protein product, partial [Ascophyllum nodosum]
RDGDHLQRSRGQRQHRPRGGNHVPDGVRRATSAVRTSLPGLCRHRGLRRNLAIMIAFVIPAYLNLISQKMCEERFGSSRTPFTGDVVSSTPVLYACMVLGTLLFVGLM